MSKLSSHLSLPCLFADLMLLFADLILFAGWFSEPVITYYP